MAKKVTDALYGAHLSVAGGMVNALDEAERLKFGCLQVFTKNQRQWRVRPLPAEDRDAWLAKLDSMGWRDPSGPMRVISHNSYLINMASPDPELWRRSVALQRVELARCEMLAIPACVAHPGAHTGEVPPPDEHRPGRPPNRDETKGLKRIVKALNQIHRELRGGKVLTLLETTAGAGSNLGYDFHHLAWIRENVRDPERVGFCLDTCHVTAAGYDMTTPARARAVLEEWDDLCGLEQLRAIHVNDSVGAIGSRRDRHAGIGDGTCGMACFAALVNHRALRSVPKILETPKGETDKGTAWDVLNIRRLKRLAKAPGSSR